MVGLWEGTMRMRWIRRLMKEMKINERLLSDSSTLRTRFLYPYSISIHVLIFQRPLNASLQTGESALLQVIAN